MTDKDCNKPKVPQKKLLLRPALGVTRWIALLTAPLWGVPLMAATGSTIFNSGFENGFSGWDTLFCCNQSGQIVSSPTRAGNKAAQFTLRESDDAKRAELRTDDSVPAGSEAWYGFSQYIPNNWVDDKDSFEIVAQWGAPPDKNLGETNSRGGPPLAFYFEDGVVKLLRRWDANPVTTPKSNVGSESINLGPYQKGVWTDYVVHIKWTHKPDGFIQVYKNGKLVVDKKNVPTNRNDKAGVLGPGIGIYKPQGFTRSVKERVIVYDEVRIGGPNSSYQDVSPGGGGSKPDPGPTPSPNPDSIRVEAEDMRLSTNYKTEANRFASNEAIVSLVKTSESSSGTASFDFPGVSGKYDVTLGYFDEGDGVGKLEVRKEGELFSSIRMNQELGSNSPNTEAQVQRKIADGLSINRGDPIQIRGIANGGEWVRVDYIRFVPQ